MHKIFSDYDNVEELLLLSKNKPIDYATSKGLNQKLDLSMRKFYNTYYPVSDVLKNYCAFKMHIGPHLGAAGRLLRFHEKIAMGQEVYSLWLVANRTKKVLCVGEV